MKMLMQLVFSMLFIGFLSRVGLASLQTGAGGVSARDQAGPSFSGPRFEDAWTGLQHCVVITDRLTCQPENNIPYIQVLPSC